VTPRSSLSRTGTLRALLLAPPGAGKGTQGDRLAQIYGVPHISTGDLLRENVAQHTEAGTNAESFLERGELVPDELVSALVLHRLSEPELLDGFVLDGFPRTIAQANLAYEWGVAHDRTFHAVIHLEVPVAELITRLLHRSNVEGRSDDTEDTIRRRLGVYTESTEPLLNYYGSRGILITVDGTGPIDDVTRRIRQHLDVRIAGSLPS
jgi:adenylate kinase